MDSKIQARIKEITGKLDEAIGESDWHEAASALNDLEDLTHDMALLTSEPEPCEDAQWWTCPDCGARYPLTPTEKLGDEEYDGPTQYFVSQGGLRTPRVYGSRPVICACKASQVAAKQTEDLRAENERLLEALTIISKRDDWTGGECRHHAHDAIMGAWPISTHPDNGDNKPNA